MAIKLIIEYKHYYGNYQKTHDVRTRIREFKDSDSVTDENVLKSLIEICDGPKCWNEIRKIQII